MLDLGNKEVVLIVMHPHLKLKYLGSLLDLATKEVVIIVMDTHLELKYSGSHCMTLVPRNLCLFLCIHTLSSSIQALIA